MNIFYLDNDPQVAAISHCDKHVVKMIVESAQLLSTAHRINDGDAVRVLTDSGRRATRYVLSDNREQVLYKATHANHPSAVWCRKSAENYVWLYNLFLALLDEYKVRYSKDHACLKLVEPLSKTPKKINTGSFYQPPQAMPDHCKVPGDSVSAYRKYYVLEKRSFAKWTKRPAPQWFAQA